MFIELIGVFMAGIAVAGVVMLLNRATGRRLPKWLIPVAAGAAMIGTTISNEYSWFDRTAGNLPDGLTIAQTVEDPTFYRPWTYAYPFVERFVAVDTGTMRTNPALPDQRMVDLYFFGRWSPISKGPVVFDCAANRRADLIDGAEFASDGSLPEDAWRAVAPDDPILQTTCKAA